MQFKQTTIRAIALISSVVILGAIGGCALSLTDDTADTADVTVTPNQAYAGDSVEITVAGFPGDYSLPAGSVTIGGVMLPLPGIFGEPGLRPQTNVDGLVTFTTVLPADVPSGTQTLAVATADGLGEKTASITVLSPSISIYPNPAVPNQAVVITGTGFTPAASGAGRLGAHQITGIGTSVVSATGTTLRTSYVTYPIDVDTDGGLYARIRVPSSYVSHSGGSIIIKVRDSGNRTGSVDLALRGPEIYLVPATSGAGDKVQVIGSGFPANSGLNSGCQRVKVLYKDLKVATAIPDSSGSFSTTIEVPRTTAISSSNTVTATPEGCAGNLSATATHTVPSRSITVTPNLTWPGATVTVTGVSFTGFTVMSQALLDPITTIDDLNVSTTTGTSVLPASSQIGANGGFSFTFVVPTTATVAAHTVQVTAGGLTSSNSFVVVKQSDLSTPTPAATLTPVPTPTTGPPQSMSPATGMEPLGDGLVRAWLFGNADGWTFYDPRPEYAEFTNLTHLIPGRHYWIEMQSDQEVVLNSRLRRLREGWNLISW